MAEGPSVLLAAPVAGMVLKGSGILARRFIRWCGPGSGIREESRPLVIPIRFFLYALQKGI